jgi:hypothetical protein
MWEFILTDLAGVVASAGHGEVTQAAARSVTLPHKRIPSAGFTIPIWHPMVPTLLDTDCLLKAYRRDPITGTRTLAFHGPVVSVNENGEGNVQTVAVTAAGPMWRLSKRIIPASKLVTGVQYGVEGAPLDLGHIARTILSECNAVHYTGIDLGTHTASVSGWVGPWWLKNAGEGIAELAAGLTSFDHRIRPVEATSHPNAQGWPTIGLFDAENMIGVTRPDAIFEYGTPRANIASYQQQVTRDGMVTSAIASVQGWPDGVERFDPPPGSPEGTLGDPKYSLVQRTDAAAAALRGMFEEVVDDAGVLDDGLRENIADYHLDVRKQPRRQITVKPTTNATPIPFVDYEVGDFIRARAVVRGSVRFDAQFRIWGMAFTLDENGNESVELELVMP